MTDRDTFLREVDEAVRQDKYKQLWDRYGIHALIAAVVIIGGVAGYKGWIYWQEKQAQDFGHPKLTVMIHEGFADASVFAMRRGPTLRVPASDGQDMETDVFAAIEAVWPRLGRSPGERLQ